MREAPYLLDANRRAIVLKTIRDVAGYRRWTLHACHVRTTHVHVIVTAQDKPEKIMSDFKAYASRRLKEHLNERADCKRWTHPVSVERGASGCQNRVCIEWPGQSNEFL